MHKTFDVLMKLAQDENFWKFQNNLALAIYNELGQGYSASENEVSLVTRLCNITQNRAYGPIYIHSEKIHGLRSYVEFTYMDKPVTKELGDMAAIAIISRGRERLLQKLCLIQNKKGKESSSAQNKHNTRWDIDLEQLYLLKNFPMLIGRKGILRNCPDISFRNTSGCLGFFGLLDSPGEMICITAPLLAELLKGKKSLTKSDISVISHKLVINSNMGSPFHFYPLRHPKELIFFYEEMLHRYGYIFPFVSGVSMSFLGRNVFLRDIYDFTRAWTQFNIGEMSFVFGKVINATVDGFANALLRRIGFTEFVEIPVDSRFAELPLENELGISVTHIDIDKEY